ncbi:hypothetical protein FHX08_003425 [Rhizobium sp. BK529]|uniref:hypothetical protein n=1 Tax=unclassified Rhizobium TaxID=2613769 RepID=UPI0010506D9B|nr:MULTISPECIES: hypothetical protein [unclassified Rhizobium]MBB3593081.1 hypothetical protein [Rhizobium sp. BK529]TCS07462.1 hypothetical protein EV281_1021081 [Rhizobium sp. BK418]
MIDLYYKNSVICCPDVATFKDDDGIGDFKGLTDTLELQLVRPADFRSSSRRTLVDPANVGRTAPRNNDVTVMPAITVWKLDALPASFRNPVHSPFPGTMTLSKHPFIDIRAKASAPGRLQQDSSNPSTTHSTGDKRRPAKRQCKPGNDPVLPYPEALGGNL